MTHSDTRPVGRREGNPTEASSTSVHNTGYGKQPSIQAQGKSGNGYEGAVNEPPSTQAQGSQGPSSMSVRNTGYQTTYEGHGGYTGDVHDAPSTQAKYNRDPKSMSVNSIGYGKPTTISAQGNSGHDITDDQFRRYENGYGSDVKEPQYQAQRNPKSKPVDSSGYGNIISHKGHGGNTGVVHDAPSTQASSNQNPSSGYRKPTSIPEQGKSGHGTSDEFRRYENGYENDVQEPPSYQAQRNPKSKPVYTSGYGNIISHEGHGGYTGAVHNAPSTQAKSNQNPSSGYRKPTSIPEQGKSGHGTSDEFRRYENGYENDVQEPPSYQAQRNPKSKPVYTSGYGNIISREGHGGYTGVVHDAPSTQAKSNQNPSSGYRKPTSIPEQGKSGHGAADEFRRYENEYKCAVHEAPSTQAQGSQGPSSKSSDNTGYGNRHEGHGGYTMTGAQGMQNPSSMPVSDNTGYEIPYHATGTAPLHINVDFKIGQVGQDGTCKVHSYPAPAPAPPVSRPNPAPAPKPAPAPAPKPAPAPAPKPAPAHTKPPKSFGGCCSIL